MKKNGILLGITGTLLGFIIGFFIANATYRRERESVQPGARAARSDRQKGSERVDTQNAEGSSGQFSEAEIRDAIAKADARADDITLQKNFGLALYRYGDPQYFPDVARLLKRAYDANMKDRELTVLLANVLFDIGQSTDPERFSEARIYCLKALEMKSDDTNVRTALGLTYYLGRPSDPQRAIAEYRKALATDPRHELALQNLATALISTGNIAEAQKRVDELQSVNPKSSALSNLRAQLAQSKNAGR